MKLKKLFQVVLGLGIAIFVLVMLFSAIGIGNIGESEMVAASYLWVPMLFFSAYGLFRLKKPQQNLLRNSVLYAALGLALLALFYNGIWPLL